MSPDESLDMAGSEPTLLIVLTTHGDLAEHVLDVSAVHGRHRRLQIKTFASPISDPLARRTHVDRVVDLGGRYTVPHDPRTELGWALRIAGLMPQFFGPDVAVILRRM